MYNVGQFDNYDISENKCELRRQCCNRDNMSLRPIDGLEEGNNEQSVFLLYSLKGR